LLLRRLGLVLVGILGCGGEPTGPPPRPFEGLELEVAALGDPALLEAIRVQTGEWERDTGARLSIRAEAADVASAATADLILFPGEQLGTLVDAGLLARIPEAAIRPVAILGVAGAPPVGAPAEKAAEEADTLARRDVLDFSDVALPFREQVSKYGDERMALPLGGSSLVLVYRRDAFHNAANREAAGAAGVALEPPATWEQLDALARFFQGRDWNGDGRPDHGIAAPLGPDEEGLGTDLFVARSAAFGQPADQYALLFDAETLEPRIASPPFVEALQALVGWKDAGPPEMANFDAGAARAAFCDGRAALLIDRPERALRWTNPQNPVDVAVAPLPASTRVFDPLRKSWITPRVPNRIGYLRSGGGWLGGVNARSERRKAEAALALLIQLASPEIAQEIVSDPAFPMVPVRSSNLALGLPDPRAAVGVDSRVWGRAVLETFGAPRVVVSLRIPDAAAYLAELDTARLSAIAGADPTTALERTADLWQARSNTLGRERQLWHYRRSLNKLSTAPEPPLREAKP
jgi:multiple sugar transport system substrate-binding protein